MGPAEIAHGPMFIGFVFNAILYGIMITQCYLYSVTSKSDRLWIKLFVAILLIADTLNTVFNAMYLYDAVIIHFNDPKYLETANWVFATSPALTAIIAAMVQTFFAWRVKALTSNMWFVTAIMFFTLVGLFCGLGAAIGVGIVRNFIDIIKVRVVGIPWLVANSVGDVLITSILVWHLAGLKSGIAATDNTINRIIRVTVETGMCTSICAVVDLITFLVIPTGIHLIFNSALSKLYTNSLMSSLNSRATWSSRSDSSTPRSFVPVLNSSRSSQLSKNSKNIQGPKRPKQLLVHVESHEMRDWGDKKPEVNMAATNDVPPSIVDLRNNNPNPETRKLQWANEKQVGEAV